MAQGDVKFTVSAVDKASPVLKKIDKSFDSTAAWASALRRKMAFASAWIAASLWTIAIAAVNMSATFEKEMTNVSTLIDTTVEDFAAMKDEVLDISTRVPVALSDLTVGLFNVRSAWIAAWEAMWVLENSAQLAVAGLWSTNEAVDLATSAINSFSLSWEEANKAFNTIFLTTKNWKTTVSELAQSFWNVAWVASAAWVSFNELMAATSALTTTGQKASVAQTQLRAAILAIQAPTGAMKDLLSKAWIESWQAALKNIGLVKTMEKITKASWWNAEAMKKAFWSVEALWAAISLTWNQAQAFQDTMVSMETDVTALDEAFAKQNETFLAQSQVLKNQLNAVMISLWTAILPLLTSAVQALNSWLQVLVWWFQALPWPVQDWIALFWILVIWTLAAVTAFAFLKIALGWIIVVAAPIIAALLPVIAVIASIVAWVTLARIAWESNFLWIQEKTKAFWAFIFETIPAWFTLLKWWFSEWLEFISTLWWNIWDWIAKVTTSIIWWISDFIAFQFNFIKDFLTSIFQWIVAVANAFFLLFQWDWQGAWESVSWAFQNTWSVISEFFSVILSKISQAWTVFYSVFKQAFNLFIEWIKFIWTWWWDFIQEVVTGALTWIVDTFKSFWPVISEGFTNMISWIWDITKDIFNGVLGTIEGFINDAIWLLNKMIRLANEIPGVSITPIRDISFWRLAHWGMAWEGFFWGQKMANGGVVTGWGWIDKVPTMLSAWEVVLNASRQSNLANQLERQQGWGSVTVQITWNNFYWDDESFVDKIWDTIIEKFSQHTAFPSF